MLNKREQNRLIKELVPLVGRAVQAAIRAVQAIPRSYRIVLALAGLIVVLLVLFLVIWQPRRTDKPAPPQSAEGYLFCFWNVENLFDDQNDRRSRTDEKYDNQFAADPKLLETKLGNLSKVLLAMNDGRGPDILAVAEVENGRALELLKERLNADLGERAAPYEALPFQPVAVGRHIAPGILTRLPAIRDRTHKLGKAKHRILEGHINVEGHQLVVIASHWKSRVPSPGEDDEGESGDAGRAEYANVVFGRFHEMYQKNERIDCLVCGDFNDDPHDTSVTVHLRGTGDRGALTAGMEPRLFNLAAGKDPETFGTLNYNNRWNVFDQILVAPGLLDDMGWTCNVETFRTERNVMSNKRGRPWRFDEDFAGRRYYDTKFSGQRGFADHFPVTVRLKVKKG